VCQGYGASVLGKRLSYQEGSVTPWKVKQEVVRQKSHSELITQMLQVSTGKYYTPAKNLRSALSV